MSLRGGRSFLELGSWKDFGSTVRSGERVRRGIVIKSRVADLLAYLVSRRQEVQSKGSDTRDQEQSR